MSLKTVKCHYENGDIITSDISRKLSDEEITEYFLNNYFNLGGLKYDWDKNVEVEYDNMQKCIKVEIL